MGSPEDTGAARYGRILNSFLHDLATGVWAACVLVLWILADRAEGLPDAAIEARADAMWMLFLLAVAALALVAATGAVRLLYWRGQTAPADRATKRKALLAKHAAFVVVYGAGTWFAWTLARWPAHLLGP